MSKSKRKLKNRLKHRKKKHNESPNHTPDRNHHHLTPKSRKGKANPGNLLLIKIERHRCWHEIFGNRTLQEVIELLRRIERAKRGLK